jgi:gluconolactonase
MAHTLRSLRPARLVCAPLVCGVALLASACAGNLSDSPAAPPAASSDASSATAIIRLDPALESVLAPGAVLERVAGGFNFVEGPVWAFGEIWFSDLVGNKLYAVGSDGATRVLLENSGGVTDAPHSDYPGSNGAVVDRDGSVLMAQHAARRIVRVTRDMTITPVVERDAQGRRLNSPNDMVFAPDGALWFTDPAFGLAGFDASYDKEIPYNGVYRWKDGQITAVIVDLPNPNGIALSPDGRLLYVSNSGPDMFVNVYDVAPNGSVGAGRRLISYPGPQPGDVPDGLKVDSLGNIWTSGPGGIRIITPQGRVLGQIRTPDTAQANIAWGGADGRTAFITATSNVYRLRLAVPGLRPHFGS